jgi:LPS-assembly lipoprotein
LSDIPFRRRRKLLGLLAVAALASACGFQLQGTPTLPPAMARTHIRAADTHSEFYWQLRRELEAAGVEVVDGASDATAVFTVYLDDTDQRVLSVSARNIPTEYEVYYTVQYGITTGSDTLVPVQDLTLTRDYTYDPTLVLGKSREEELLRERIAGDLVRIVMEQAAVQ